MPLRSLCAEVFKIEEIAEELSRALGDDDRVRLGNALQTRREVRRLADDRLLLSRTRSDQIADYDQPGGNADAGLQWSTGLQPAHRFDQLQPRPYRPLGVVLMGLRIAEVDEHAVAHVLRYEPAEALHSLGDALLIGGNDLAQVLRVHAGRECRRTDEVREHHRDLAALGGVLGLRLGASAGCGGACRRHRQARAIAAQHLSPMPEQDADAL